MGVDFTLLKSGGVRRDTELSNRGAQESEAPSAAPALRARRPHAGLSQGRVLGPREHGWGGQDTRLSHLCVLLSHVSEAAVSPAAKSPSEPLWRIWGAACRSPGDGRDGSAGSVPDGPSREAVPRLCRESRPVLQPGPGETDVPNKQRW